MLWKLFVIFLGGVVVDLLVTKYTVCVAQHRPKTAAALSGIITLTNIGIWGTIIHEAETLGVYGAISMAIGASVGTLLGFKQKIFQPPSPGPESRSPASATPASSPSTITGLISP
jgi:Na+-driven multidrug efflux pump